MKKVVASLIVAAALVALAGSAHAQAAADHLKCYRVKDTAATKIYTANLTGLVPENGCMIRVPAKALCTASSKTGVSPTPPGGGPSGTAAGTFACYKLKCPRTALTAVQVTDQFGSRTMTPSVAKLLCAPAMLGTTTTTTLPSAGCGTAPTCGGNACGSGMVCSLVVNPTSGSQGCACAPGAAECTPTSAMCSTGACPSGSSCMSNPGPGGGCACF